LYCTWKRKEEERRGGLRKPYFSPKMVLPGVSFTPSFSFVFALGAHSLLVIPYSSCYNKIVQILWTDWYPVLLIGTKFHSLFAYTQIGDDTGKYRVKLGPKDRVTLRINLKVGIYAFRVLSSFCSDRGQKTHVEFEMIQNCSLNCEN
jgi:hypothetical protein